MKTKTVEMFVTEDGREFPTQAEAIEHEATLVNSEEITAFLNTADVKPRFKNTLRIYLSQYEAFKKLMQG